MKKLSVMLVEDDSDDAEIAVWTLKKIGLEDIVVARDGLEAVQMRFGDEVSGVVAACRPDIIILDMRLPKIDGLDVLRKIRSDERTKEIKVYALTSSTDPYDRQVCAELGVSAFFSKPLKEKVVLNIGEL
jgi:CheY-like chemotaxis protein